MTSLLADQVGSTLSYGSIRLLKGEEMVETSIDEHAFLVDVIHDMLKSGVLDRIKLF